MIPETGTPSDFKHAVLKVVQGYTCFQCGSGETFDLAVLEIAEHYRIGWTEMMSGRYCSRCYRQAAPRITVTTVDTCGV